MSIIRTSQTHPLEIAAVRAGEQQGRIGITFCPGKQDPHALTGAWARDLDTDLQAIRAWGATLVLTLVESFELAQLKVPRLGEAVERQGMDWCHLPIPDYSVPDAGFEQRWLTEGKALRQRLRQGQDIVVHCKGGLGRAGMIAARLLVELGVPAKEAIRRVRRERRGAIETPSQLTLVLDTRALSDDEQ